MARVCGLALVLLVAGVPSGAGQEMPDASDLGGACDASSKAAGCRAAPGALGVGEQPDRSDVTSCAGRCDAAAASLSESISMVQVRIRKHKERGPQGDNPNVALLGDDVGKDRGLSTTSGCSYGVEMSGPGEACESYSCAAPNCHVGSGGWGSHNYESQALKCAPYCSAYFSIGESGDCRCCSGSYSTGRGAWATWRCKPAPQPVPCQMGTWSAWGACSESCGAGKRSRSRSVISQPKNGGTACGETVSSEGCSDKPCPVDCKLGDWGGWGACSATCGPGKRSRSRTVDISQKDGGEPCENTEEEGDCPPSFCPVALDVLEVCGKVVNAVDNSPVEGATVNLQDPQPGTSASAAHTDSGGKFCFTGPQPGTTTLTATLQGWVDHHAPLTITAGMSSFEDVVMSKKIASTKWRIILTWQKEKDLDSHTKFGDCDVYHGKKECDNGMSGVLDLDSTDNRSPKTRKPETTTVQADPSKCGEDCMIFFRVRNYSKQSPLSESQAMVQVIHGDQEAETFEIGKAGNGAGVVENGDWYVLAIDVKSGKVIACTNAQTKCV